MIRRKKILLFSGCILLLAAIALHGLLLNSFFLTRILLPVLSEVFDLPLSAGKMRLNPYACEVRGDKICIGPKETPYFVADRARFRYCLRDLVDGKIHFENIYVRGGEFVLKRNPKGEWYCGPDTSTTTDESLEWDLRNMKVVNSRLVIINGQRPKDGMLEYSHLSGQADRFTASCPFNGAVTGKFKITDRQGNSIVFPETVYRWKNLNGPELLPEKFCTTLQMLDGDASLNGERRLKKLNFFFDLDWIRRGDQWQFNKLNFKQTRDGAPASEIRLRGKIDQKIGSWEGNLSRGDLSPEVISIASLFLFQKDVRKLGAQVSGHFSNTADALQLAGKFKLRYCAENPENTLELAGEQDLFFDWHRQNIRFRTCNAKLTNGSKEAGSLKLRKPVEYSWAGKPEGEQAVADLLLHSFDLRVLNEILPTGSSLRWNGKLHSHSVFTFYRNLSAMEYLIQGSITGLNLAGKEIKQELSNVDFMLSGKMKPGGLFLLDLGMLSLQHHTHLLGSARCSGSGSLLTGKWKFSGTADRLSPDAVVWSCPGLLLFPDKWHKLGAGEGKVEVELVRNNWKSPVTVKKLQLFLRRQEAPEKNVLELTFSPFGLSDQGLEQEVHFQGKLAGRLNKALQVPGFGGRVAIESGTYSGSLQGSLLRNRRWLFLRGELGIDNSALTTLDHSWRDLKYGSRFDCSIRDLEYVDFQEFEFYLHCFGRPALRIEAPGQWNLTDGRYSGEWKIRYLNENFIRLFSPSFSARTELSGQLNVDSSADGTIKMGLAAETPHLTLAASPLTLRGNCSANLNVTRDKITLSHGEILLKTGQQDVLTLALNGKISRSGEEPGTISIAGKECDLSLIKELWANPAQLAKRDDNTGFRPQLQLGNRDWNLNLDLNKLTLAPGLGGSLQSRLILQAERIETEQLYLQLNESCFSGAFSAFNGSDGINWQFRLSGGEKPLKITPLYHWLLGVSNKHLLGEIGPLSLQAEICDDGKDNSFARTVRGKYQAQFRDLSLPADLYRSPVGRLLLFPVDVAAKGVGLLPNELKNWGKRFDRTKIQEKGFGSVDFDSGRISICFQQGNVSIDECLFLGPTVKMLSFEGGFQLTGQQNLQLLSRISAGGGQLTLPIGGTLSSPAVDWQKAATDPAADWLKKIGSGRWFGIDHEKKLSEDPLIVLTDVPVAGGLFRVIRSVFVSSMANGAAPGK